MTHLFFARAGICNTFLFAKICYGMQVINCTRAHVLNLHRVFALLIWRSSTEPMRRGNLFRSVESGGLGLKHLLPQLPSRFCFLRDQEHPFLRTVLQTRLFCALPCFFVSSCQEEPGRVFGYLREVADAFHALSVCLSLVYLTVVSRKKKKNYYRF